ncbi:MAG: YhdP family protein [Pontibacterium sp.]
MSVLALCALTLLLCFGSFLYLPQLADTLKPHLESRWGIVLAYEGLETEWQGVKPALRMASLSVLAPQQGTQLNAEQVHIVFDTHASLYWQRPLFEKLAITSPTIQVSPASLDGQVTSETSNLPSSNEQSQSVVSLVKGVMTAVMRQPSIELIHGHFELKQAGETRLKVSDITLMSEGQEAFGQVALRAELEGPTGLPITLLGLAESGLDRSAPMRVKLSLPSIDAPWVNAWLPDDAQPLDSLTLSYTLVAELRFGKLQRLVADLAAKELGYGELQVPELDINADLQPQWLTGGYQLQLATRVTGNDASQFALPKVAVNFDEAASAVTHVALEPFDVEPLMAFISQQSLAPARVIENLEGFNFQGRVSDAVMRVLPERDEQGQPRWAGSASVNKFGMSPWVGAPGLKNVSATAVFSGREGYFDIDADQFEIEVPGLGVEPWGFEQAFGRLHWRFDDTKALLTSGPLTVKDGDTTGRGRLSVSLPYSRQVQPELTLMIGAKNADLLSFFRYIPPKEVGTETHAWLARAFSKGRLTEGAFVLNGVTRPSLDDWRPPSVQIYLDGQAVDFSFDPQWPLLTTDRARFLFKQGAFYSDFKGGSFLASQVGDGFVALNEPLGDLVVEAGVSGPASDLTRVLRDTPLKQTLGEEPERWQVSEGQANTRLGLTLPTSAQPRQPSQVTVRADIANANVAAPSYNLAFSQVQGGVTYDLQQGISVDNATAVFLERPVSFSVATSQTPLLRDDKTLEPRYTVTALGSVAVDPLKHWLSLPLLNVMSGIIPYELTLPLCQGGEGCNLLSVTTDLVGAELAGVDTLSKSAADVWNSRVDVQLLGSSSQHVWLKLGESVKGIFRLEHGQLTRGKVSIGRAAPDMPSTPGFFVDATLPTVDVEQVQDFLVRTQLVEKASEEGGEEVKATSTTLFKPPRESFFKGGEFDVQYLSYEDYLFKDVKASLNISPASWLIGVSGPALQGWIELPTEGENTPVSINLDRLSVSSTAEAVATSTGADVDIAAQAGEYDLTRLPTVKVNIASLTYQGQNYGAWSFNLLPDEWGATFQGIQGKVAGASVKGDARWSHSGDPYSAALINVSGRNLGELVSMVNDDPVIESQTYNADIRLVWPGVPWAFSLAVLSGDMDMSIERGRLLDMEKSNLLMRGLGILNLETLTRRLRLDFSDLTKQGVAFDRVNLQYRLLEGVATTRAPSILKGPSIDLEMRGKVDLANQSLDQVVKVILPVTKNLPLMGLLLGQPQIAGAVYLFDKLIGGKIEKATGINYQVSGDWSDPSVELITREKQAAE